MTTQLENDPTYEVHAATGNTVNFTEDVWAILIAGFIILISLLLYAGFPSLEITAPVYKWKDTVDFTKIVSDGDNLLSLSVLCGTVAVLAGIAFIFSGTRLLDFLKGFVVILAFALLSLFIAGNQLISSWGIEYVVFALVLGLIAGNLFSLPAWVKQAARSEFYIKTGLVILGTSVLFTDIIKAGLPGILQSVIVVAVVWFFSLWLSRKLKVDDEFGVILASAVSICGVSAAIVASGAIQGDKRKLSYVTTLVLLVAIPMLVLQPWIIKHFNIPELVGGAWLGGTLDTTASVTAAAQLVGPAALKVGVIVKFSQNVLIGVAAFLIAGWWVLRKDTKSSTHTEQKGLAIVWERFPKFVLGFIAASLLFSFVVPAHAIKQTSGILNSIRTLWFALAFVSIGMEARFKDIVSMEGGRPAFAFIGAQLFNIAWTLFWAWLLFSGSLFAVPEIR